MTMEINIWGWLWNGSPLLGRGTVGKQEPDSDDGNLLLRLRIPEVCVFKGCTLDGWYHTNSSGLVVRRKHSVTLEEMLRVFLASAPRAPTEVGGKDPEERFVAILRRNSTKIEEGAKDLDVPHGELLTARALRELLRDVENGYCAADIWSVQALVAPSEDVRTIVVYSCDAMGTEKGDMFGRGFYDAYPMDRRITIPSPEVIAGGQCFDVPRSRQAILETKTLSVVRFASRFHSLDFEGLVLEFVFDSQERAVLHGCWCSSLFGPGARRRASQVSQAMGFGAGAGGGAVPVGSRGPFMVASARAPRSFPVPSVAGGGAAEAAEATAAAVSAEMATAPAPKPRSTEMLGLSLVDTGGVDPVELWHSKIGSHGCGGGATGAGTLEECCVLLELWRGQDFLGEALVPCGHRGAPPKEHTLRLRLGEVPWPSRPEKRKALAAAARPSAAAAVGDGGCVTVRLQQLSCGEAGAPPVLRFGVLRAEGLELAAGGATGCYQVLLWSRRRGCTDFATLWRSSEVQEAPRSTGSSTGAMARWAEYVDLALGPPQEESGQVGGGTSPLAASAAAVDSGGAEERPGSVTVGPAGNRRSQSQSHPTLELPQSQQQSLQQPSQHQSQHNPVEFQTSLASPLEHVLGAELTSHWGMSEADGSMRTHVLCKQVLQRFSAGRLNRSGLLAHLAEQLQQYNGLQVEWEEQLDASKGTSGRVDEEIRRLDAEIARIRREMGESVAMRERQLASMCRELCGGVDEHRIEEHKDEGRLAHSRQRITEQRSMVHQLVDRNHALQGSLDKTVQKFDEVSSSYAQVQAELAQRQALRNRLPGQDPELLSTLAWGKGLSDEIQREAREVDDLKQSLEVVQNDLDLERNHSLQLEDFVRCIAKGPGAVRTGGGYDVDFAARREAAMLVQDMAEL
mmetsp:Transcript_38507/g.83860  ORF Transcript_38507/g.83860 Transcript_38507/m.83860 type:complete len:909 (+) Transcript_38507:120-2846(+)